MDDAQRALFRKLKPVCVPLLPLARVAAPSTAKQLVAQLKQLDGILQEAGAIDKTLATYALFPLTQVLSLNSLEVLHKYPTVLETTLRTFLSLLGNSEDKSIPTDTLQQLWFVCILVLGGPIDTSLNGKGKQKAAELLQWPESTVFIILEALKAIIPLARPEKMLQLVPSLFSGPENHTQEHKDVPFPVIAHTLTTFLDQLPTSPLEIQLELLSCLEKLVSGYMPRYLCAQFLPGYVSSMCRVVRQPNARSKAINSNLGVTLLEQLGNFVTRVLSNESCQPILDKEAKAKPRIVKLEDLADVTESRNSIRPDDENNPVDTTSSGLDTPAWLNATTHQIHRALQSIIPILSARDDVLIRLQLLKLAEELVCACWRTLQPESTALLLDLIIRLTQDDWDQVALKATKSLQRILAPAEIRHKGGNSEDFETLAELAAKDVHDTASRLIATLPQTIMTHGDDHANMSSVLNLLKGSLQALNLCNLTTTGLAKQAERWSWTLLRALEFPTLPKLDQGESRGVQQAWSKPAPALLTYDGPDTAEDSGMIAAYDQIKFKRLQNSHDVRQLAKTLAQLAKVVARGNNAQQLALLEHFLNIARSNLGASLRASAWWTLAALLAIDHSSINIKLPSAVSKYLRLIAEEAIKQLDNAADDILEGSDPPTQSEDESTLVERRKGFDRITPYVDGFDPSSTAASIDSARDAQQSHLLVCTCMAMRTLSECALLLGSDFQPHLMVGLYAVLAKMGAAEHPTVREHAETTLSRIAYACNHASTQNLVLANVDYVINAASQRLLPTKLDPMAPEVLIIAIRLAGPPIIPYIQDVVDDLFDALDNYHGYDALLARLLSVLDTLIKSLGMAPVEPKDMRNRPAPFYKPAEPSSNLQVFIDWHTNRRKFPKMAEFPKETEVPQRPWTSENPDPEQQPQPDTEEEEKVTRPQVICADIITKATYFLSHASAFIRARMLSLLASAVPVLGPTRSGDLLPVINTAWPIILKRLSPTEEGFVVTEAAVLVEQLATHVGEFMCRRVLDDAWPCFVGLIEQRQQSDRNSALTGQTVYTLSTRLYLAIINSMSCVVGDVPLRDGVEWPIATHLRVFFAQSEFSVVREAAVRLFKRLALHKPEVVWLITRSLQNYPGYPLCLGIDNVSLDVASIFEN